MKITWPIEESRAIYKYVQLQEVMHTRKGTLPLCVSLWSEVVGLIWWLEFLQPIKAKIKIATLFLLQFKSLVHFIRNLDNQQASFDEIVQ
jgi:hypothetical protein